MKSIPVKLGFWSLIIALSATSLFAQQQNSKPKLNQLGFYADGPKLAITPEISNSQFHIRDTESGIIVYEGTLSSDIAYDLSEETVKIADFSDFKRPGTYQLYINGGEASYPFEIGDTPFDALSDGLIKALYFNRVSVPLEPAHAGVWSREAGHPDDQVIIHPSAASTGRPAGSTISSPGGWYDAGDFNKYVVPISSSINHMLFAYEQFPDYFNNRDLNIPESDNVIPDMLDEALFALRWLLTMQDPGDGGVYNKLTHANFQGTVMPAEATAPRYVVQKGTAATLDFAAVMAQAARVYETIVPDFADSALAAAEAAWDWAELNPSMAYDQNAMNTTYDPDINTGGYGDGDYSDEWFWAGVELYITTEDEAYYPDGGWNELGVSGWGNVQALGVFSLVHHRANLTAAGLADTTAVKNALINAFDWYVNDGVNSAYRSPFGIQSWQFGWGSNGTAGNLGMGILMAYQLTGNQKYYDGAVHIMDYLLGRNAVGYSYVTGFGDQAPMHIHHRQSQADNVAEPTPGWVAGGANPNNQSQDCGSDQYSSSLPALAYADKYCSYSTNEITTYWNSPFIYLAAGLEYLTADYLGYTPPSIQFTPYSNPDTLFDANDPIPIHWSANGVTSVDILYKRFSDSDYSVIASDVDASSGEYSGFTAPDLPGDSLVIQIRNSANSEEHALSSVIKLAPAPYLKVKSISSIFGTYDPGVEVTIRWEYFEVDSLDLSYKLKSESGFTFIARLDATDESYSGFALPDAQGDSIIFKLTDVSSASNFTLSDPILIGTAVNNEPNDGITKYSLAQNYPNPFNPSTSIEFEIPEGSHVSLKVFDPNGRIIASLVNGFRSQGRHIVNFDASELATGLYLYQLETPSFSSSKKMLLIK